MINVFVVHSGKDYTMVKEVIEPFLLASEGDENSFLPSCNILTLESGVDYNWKKDAAKKIKMSHAIIVVVGDDANQPSKAGTMGWEVARAAKFNKLIMIYNPKNNPIPDYLMIADRFTKQKRVVAPQMSLEEIKQRIEDYVNGNYPIFSPEYAELSTENKLLRKGELIDQYKMFQKTSEDLVARRQNVNSFYLTVNSVLTALVGVVLGVVGGSTKLIVVAFMCVAGMILDISWINILGAYGTLNAAKLKVIRILEEQLPVTLYDAEWMIMSDKLNNKKYVSFTDSEKRIPKLFMALYALILAGISIFFIYTFISEL
jgi:hypothetical protein